MKRHRHAQITPTEKPGRLAPRGVAAQEWELDNRFQSTFKGRGRCWRPLSWEAQVSDPLLLGVSDQVFLRGAVTVVLAALSAAGALAGIMFRAAVRYLGEIAKDINELKTSAAVMLERSESHEERLARVEGAVFSAAKGAG